MVVIVVMAVRGSPARRRAAGQATVELALIAPVLFLMLAGILDLGRTYQAYVMITNATREGARFASKSATNAGATSCPCNNITASGATNSAKPEYYVFKELEGASLAGSTGPTLTIQVTCSPSCASGNPVTVTVSTTVSLITGSLLRWAGGSSFANPTISNSLQMKILS